MSQSPSERKIMFGVSALSTTVFLALSILVFVKAIYMALPITIAMMLVSLGPLAIDYKKMKGWNEYFKRLRHNSRKNN